ncbi:MAG: lysine--tRNA ligase [Planctomycetaceae bacterium]|nr:lysine--tRNA ligase [Planctomycetaceae bacterium]
MTQNKKPDRFEAARLQKAEKIVELGHDPFGQRFDDHRSIAAVRPLCPTESGINGEAVRVAGRIMLRRKAGKLRFIDIEDATGKIQLLFSRADLSDHQWELMGALDLGDLIGIDGHLRRTESGEVSIFVSELTILCKSFTQPPEKHHGVTDVETLLRHRELDLIYTEGVRDKLLLRSKILDSVRNTLAKRGFIAVETPVLHAIAGGAAARPFLTHHNALDIPLYMRIALELHLKRLMVGGIERVYEMSRVFRNEGIDATHNPEFTMLEAYQAYGDYRSMMDLTEAVVCDAVRCVLASGGCQSLDTSDGSESPKTSTDDISENAPPIGGLTSPARLVVPWGETEIDFTPPWPRKTYAELFAEHVGCEMTDANAVQAKARELAQTGEIKAEFIADMDAGHVHPDIVVSEVFEVCVEDNLVGPVFVIDYPASICPLTKRKQDNPDIAERFELFVNGMELANAYTELNDPHLQEELFRTQLEGQSEEDSMAKMDTDFIQALKVGMPPAGGLGIGIDRLVMLLTNSRSIRDVIFFPLLRPEGSTAGDNSKDN